MTTKNNTTDAARDAGQSTYRQARAILRICPDIDLHHADQARRRAAEDLYTAAWDAAASGDRETLAEAGLAPRCECSACGCVELATTIDDGRNRVCAACEEYTCDDDGEVLCSRCEGVETVTESCGAGNQTRSYLRKSPPEMPTEDADGKYALYWDTVGRESGAVARFATLAEAEQAVGAKDWPRPGDNTQYLCGWTVRQLLDGEWVSVTEREI